MFKYLAAAGATCILALLGLSYFYPLELDDERLPMLVLGVVLALIAFLRFGPPAGRETKFLEWLARNQREVRVGVGDYHGRRIGPKTMMIRYVWVMSPLVATFSKATEHYVVGSPEAKVAKAYCMAVTALLGWWHFYGVAATPRVLKENLRDSNAQSVAELLDYVASARTETPS